MYQLYKKFQNLYKAGYSDDGKGIILKRIIPLTKQYLKNPFFSNFCLLTGGECPHYPILFDPTKSFWKNAVKKNIEPNNVKPYLWKDYNDKSENELRQTKDVLDRMIKNIEWWREMAEPLKGRVAKKEEIGSFISNLHVSFVAENVNPKQLRFLCDIGIFVLCDI